MDKNKKQAIEWLKTANDDLDNISYIIEVEHLTNVVAFYSHQAIEKSFKALIEYQKIGFVKMYNLKTRYSKMKLLRNHTISKDKRYWQTKVGFNYRMTNLQAV